MNGQTTTYTLDLHSGLTQVLSDGETTYLYGIGRVSQSSSANPQSATAYFLGDALGSVRQMVDAQGAVRLAREYAPYGETRATITQSPNDPIPQSPYGFTGEWTDVTGLVYLRARYYAPWDGRFVSRDMWEGMSARPVSYNRWLYGEGNPVNVSDPSGNIPTRDGINDKRIVYSCNCGWIDFSHANPATAASIMDLLNYEQSLFEFHTTDYRDDAFAISPRINLPGGLSLPLTAVVKRHLGQSSKVSAALGIYRALEERFESIQFPTYWSYYSLEDLASDEIGFYLYVQFGRHADPRYDDAAWLWLARECGFPEDKEKAKDWSLEVYKAYEYSWPKWVSIKVFTWGAPWLCDNAQTGNCGASRGWPVIFTQIAPTSPQRGGDWWLYNRREDGRLYSPPGARDDVYLLRDPRRDS